MTDVGSLGDLAQTLLETAAAAVATTDAGPPAQTFLSPGLPALDRGCDLVTVWIGAVGQENTTPRDFAVGQKLRFGWVNLVTFNILAGRCLTSGAKAIPTPVQLNAAAVKVMQDGWALWNAIPRAVIDDQLFGGLCSDVRVQPIQPLTPQGNLGGWTLTVQAELAGYDPGAP